MILAQGMLKRWLRRSESRMINAIEDDRDEMSHREAMEEAVDERALIEGTTWEMVEASETLMTAQNVVLGTWGRGTMIRVYTNKVATRSTKGMKDGVGVSAKKANPAEKTGKTTLGCLVKAICLRLSIDIFAVGLLSAELVVSDAPSPSVIAQFYECYARYAAEVAAAASQ